MTEEFSIKVYPIILDVLATVDAVGKGRRFEQVFEKDRPRIKGELGRLSSGREEDELARRAIVYWIDEMFVNSPWSTDQDRGNWTHHLLEYELWESRDRAWMFYEKAKEAGSLPGTDALETFYLCVALGFRGEHRTGSTDSSTPSTLPPLPTPVRESPKLPAPPPSKSAAPPPGWRTVAGSDAAPKGKSILESRTEAAPFIQRPAGREAAPTGAGREKTKSLEEWAGQILIQIRPKNRSRFRPANNSEAAGDCAPLRGWRALQQMLVGLSVMSIVTVVVFAVWVLAIGR